jgi:hypothetical protein
MKENTVKSTTPATMLCDIPPREKCAIARERIDRADELGIPPGDLIPVVVEGGRDDCEQILVVFEGGGKTIRWWQHHTTYVQRVWAMTASKLVERLQEIIASKGDAPVGVELFADVQNERFYCSDVACLGVGRRDGTRIVIGVERPRQK